MAAGNCPRCHGTSMLRAWMPGATMPDVVIFPATGRPLTGQQWVRCPLCDGTGNYPPTPNVTTPRAWLRAALRRLDAALDKLGAL